MEQIPENFVNKILPIGKRPPPRTLHNSFIHGDLLYVYGGYDPIIGILTDLWAMDLRNMVSSWRRIEVERHEEAPKTFRNSSAKLDNKFYIFGGKLNASTSSSAISCLTIEDGGYFWRTVEQKEGTELTIDSHSCVAHHNSILIFGGFLGGDMACYSNETYKYNGSTEEIELFEAIGTRPEPRSDHSASMIGERMFIFGGISGENEFNDTWYLDLSNKTWYFVKTEGSAPSKRIGHDSVGMDDFLFVIGGSKEVSKLRANLFMLDTRDNKWQKLGDNLQPDNGGDNESVDPDEFLKQKMQSSVANTNVQSIIMNKGTHSPNKTKDRFGSPRKGGMNRRGNSNYHTPGVTTKNSLLGSGKGGLKISQAKQLKRERLAKKKAQEKAELLKEFKLTKEERNLDVEDPQILQLKNTLDALGSGRDYKIPSPKRNIMKPGIARFQDPVHGKIEPCSLPKLDGLTIHSLKEKLFIFGGDRSGLCSNDIYYIDLTNLLLSN